MSDLVNKIKDATLAGYIVSFSTFDDSIKIRCSKGFTGEKYDAVSYCQNLPYDSHFDERRIIGCIDLNIEKIEKSISKINSKNITIELDKKK